MRFSTLAILSIFVLSVSSCAQSIPNKDEQIASAVKAATEDKQADAQKPFLLKSGTIDVVMFVDCYYGCPSGGCNSAKLH